MIFFQWCFAVLMDEGLIRRSDMIIKFQQLILEGISIIFAVCIFVFLKKLVMVEQCKSVWFNCEPLCVSVGLK